MKKGENIIKFDMLGYKVINNKYLWNNEYNVNSLLLNSNGIFTAIKDKKNNFLKWLSQQNDKVTCTDSIKNWFRKTTWNWERRYILVDDANTLLMLKLHSPEAVGTVYKYTLMDK